MMNPELRMSSMMYRADIDLEAMGGVEGLLKGDFDSGGPGVRDVDVVRVRQPLKNGLKVEFYIKSVHDRVIMFVCDADERLLIGERMARVDAEVMDHVSKEGQVGGHRVATSKAPPSLHRAASRATLSTAPPLDDHQRVSVPVSVPPSLRLHHPR